MRLPVALGDLVAHVSVHPPHSPLPPDGSHGLISPEAPGSGPGSIHRGWSAVLGVPVVVRPHPP